MKRRKPLQTKKGLVSRAPLVIRSALKAKSGLTAHKALKPRSDRMKKIYEERRTFVEEMLKKFPVCQVYWNEECFGVAVDVHEVKARSAGGKIVGDSPNNYKTVCRYCHTMIGQYPQEAWRRGFVKWSWEE